MNTVKAPIRDRKQRQPPQPADPERVRQQNAPRRDEQQDPEQRHRKPADPSQDPGVQPVD